MSAERHEDSIVHSGRDWFIANIAQLQITEYVVRKYVIDTKQAQIGGKGLATGK